MTTSPLKSGDRVLIDGKRRVWRVVDFHGALVRLRPISTTGRIVHPSRLTRAPEARR